MAQTITLAIPDKLYAPIKRSAAGTNQSIEAVVLNALQASLPPLEGLPPEIMDELVQLETLDNEALRQVLLEFISPDQQEVLQELLDKKREDSLSVKEQEELTQLHKEAEKIMLRKARAGVLLRFRGQRLPTLAELEEMSRAYQRGR
jgi:hypothetical protein